jgi:hypothetical protein
MGRVAKSQQQARAKARQRRITLDYDRAARDERVEAAAAEAILALGDREDAVGQVRAAEVRVGYALQRIIREGVKVEGVAQLCELSVGDVQRLRREAQAAKDSRGIVDPAGLDPAGSTDVTVRALGHAQARRSGIDPTQRPPERHAASRTR